MKYGTDVLLVHGAAHDGSCWAPLQKELKTRGIGSEVIDLPSAGTLVGLSADTQAVRRAISTFRPRTVVCHSYGGMPTTAAVGAEDDVSMIVYLCAFVPDVGESVITLNDDESNGDEWEISECGRWIHAPNPHLTFYNEVERELADSAIARLRPQSFQAFIDSLDCSPAWQTTSSAFIMTELDHAIPLATQQHMAARTDYVHTLPTDHSPFLSMPAATAALIADLHGE